MAIIISMGVGNSRKSMGLVTYRRVRGRTIGSQKRGSVDNFQASSINDHFRAASMFIREHADDINVSFDKTKYGTSRNNFMKTNYRALVRAFEEGGITGSSTVQEVEQAVTAYATANPTAIVRVKRSGFQTVYLTGAWTSDDNPISGGGNQVIAQGRIQTVVGAGTYSANIRATRVFTAGAKVVREAGRVNIVISSLISGVEASDIQWLTEDGNVVEGLAASDVTSVDAGTISFKSPAITDSNNVVGLKIMDIFYYLPTPYVFERDETPDPGV